MYTNKKSSLKLLVDCFPKMPGGLCEDPLPVMMALPSTSSLGLTREQVMPFLKKMENGQQREGKTLLGTYSLVQLSPFDRYLESAARSQGDISAFSGHLEAFRGKTIARQALF